MPAILISKLEIWCMEFKCFEIFLLFMRTIKVLFNFRLGTIYCTLWDNSIALYGLCFSVGCSLLDQTNAPAKTTKETGN